MNNEAEYVTSFAPNVAKKTSVEAALVISALKTCFDENKSKNNEWFPCGNVFLMLPYLSERTIVETLISLFERNYIDLCRKYSVSSGEFDDWWCMFFDAQSVFGGKQ